MAVTWLVLSVRALIATTFILAAIGKILRPKLALESTSDLTGLNHSPAAVVAAIVIAVELATTVLVVLSGTYRLGLLLATLLVAAFTLAQIITLGRSDPARCACFGIRVESVSNVTVIRNIVLLLAALVAWVVANTTDQLVPLNDLFNVIGVVLGGILIAMLIADLPSIVSLFRGPRRKYDVRSRQ